MLNPLKKMHVTSPYGPRIHPISKHESFHNGVDLRANYEDAYAIEDGVVELARKTDYSIGNYMVINHGTFLAIYGHLDEFNVRQGENVKQGDVVAITGNSGASTAAHLHFEIREDTPTILWDKEADGSYPTSIDPMEFLKHPEFDFETPYYEAMEREEKLKQLLIQMEEIYS